MISKEIVIDIIADGFTAIEETIKNLSSEETVNTNIIPADYVKVVRCKDCRYFKPQCKDCKYYESYHQYPNPNAVAKHYCTKCNEEIEDIRTNYNSDVYAVWIPKGCYFNDCFEFSDEYLKIQKEKYDTYLLGCQIED